MIFNLTKTTHQNALTEKQERIVTLSQMIGIINNLVAVHGTQQTDEATFVRVTGEGKGKLTETFEFKHADSTWISVDDELPEDGVCVITHRRGGSMHIEHTFSDVGYSIDENGNEQLNLWAFDGDFNYSEDYKVTHWQPLPELP